MRIIKTGNGYELVKLAPEDKLRLYERLGRENKVIMAQCIEDARELLKKDYLKYTPEMTCMVASALFAPLATKIYSVFQDALTVKVWNEKEQAAQITAVNNSGGSVV